MAAVDALSLTDRASSPGVARWALAGAVVLALHGAALYLLNRAPAPVGFESQVPVEMDLLPPPSGAAQMQEAGAEVNSEATPQETQEQPVEELQELDEVEETEVTPPDPEAVTAEEAEDVPPDETPPTEVTELPPDIVPAPTDVEPAVALPPETTVTAREEPVEQPKPTPPVVAKKVEPKKPVVRERPKPTPPRVAEPKPAEPKPQSRPATVAQQAGGARGASANAGAARAAASNYGSRVRSAVAAQKPATTGFSARVVVSFSVSRSGAVSGISASGGGPAAAAAVAMVRRASIPAMPSEMTGGSARYSLPISFK